MTREPWGRGGARLQPAERRARAAVLGRGTRACTSAGLDMAHGAGCIVIIHRNVVPYTMHSHAAGRTCKSTTLKGAGRVLQVSKWDMRGSAPPPSLHPNIFPSRVSESVRPGSKFPRANPQCLDRVVSGASKEASAQACVQEHACKPQFPRELACPRQTPVSRGVGDTGASSLGPRIPGACRNTREVWGAGWWLVLVFHWLCLVGARVGVQGSE